MKAPSYLLLAPRLIDRYFVVWGFLCVGFEVSSVVQLLKLRIEHHN